LEHGVTYLTTFSPSEFKAEKVVNELLSLTVADVGDTVVM